VPVRADPVVADAAPPPPASPSRILRQACVIDLQEPRLIAAIDKSAPRLEDGTFFVDRLGTLHSVDLATASERWAKKPDFVPNVLAAADGFAVVGADKQLAVYDAGGAVKTIALAGRVGHAVSRAHDVLVVEDADHLLRIDLAKGTATPFAKIGFDVYGFRAAVRVGPDGKSVCAMSDPSGDLEIACFDGNGAPTLRKTVFLHEPSDPKGVSFSIRFSDARYVLYGVGPFFLGPVSRAVVVRLSDGALIAKLPENLATIVEREDGSIEGFLSVQPDLRLIEISGKTRWKVPSPNPHDEGASAVARGGRLFVDVYPPISSGSALLALDLGTGATLWHGDVHMLPIAHSEYFNDVRLSFASGRVVLRGDESSVQTFQLFDEATGKRAFFDSRQPW
jgi:outer membrane protein assembly factor BamB